jgi:DNA-directed RNA polymerase specialized sigma24 family protein
MSNPGSVTRLIEQLRSDQPSVRNEAARQIWLRFFPPLLDLACKHLDPRVRRREDEEDVLQSMYKSLCLRLKRGDFAFDNRNDLWRLMVTMTLHKTRSAATRQKRERRDYRREEPGPAAGADDSLSPEWVFGQMEQSEPTPSEAVVLTEELQRRLAILPDDLRQIALWKLEGFTNEQIAAEQKLNCSERTVERKLNLIRQKWAEIP